MTAIDYAALMKKLRDHDLHYSEQEAAADALERLTQPGGEFDLPESNRFLAGDYMRESPMYSAREVRGFLARLIAERDAWKEYAQHQEFCATCGEAVSDCEVGSMLRYKALAATEPKEKP